MLCVSKNLELAVPCVQGHYRQGSTQALTWYIGVEHCSKTEVKVEDRATSIIVCSGFRRVGSPCVCSCVLFSISANTLK